MIFPGRVRLTGDVDFFFANDAEIVGRLFIGVTTLVKNKRAAGRPRDLDDLSYLEDDR